MIEFPVTARRIESDFAEAVQEAFDIMLTMPHGIVFGFYNSERDNKCYITLFNKESFRDAFYFRLKSVFVRAKDDCGFLTAPFDDMHTFMGKEGVVYLPNSNFLVRLNRLTAVYHPLYLRRYFVRNKGLVYAHTNTSYAP
mgnify:CR=1 FL=1